MPRVAKELGPLDVKRAIHAGGKGNTMLPVGGVAGLYLQITPYGGKSWVLRAAMAGKRAEIGMGGFPTVTLAQARDKAREARDKIGRGIDPLAERKAARAALIAAARRGLTFADAVDKALTAKTDAFKNAKHRQQWENTLATYAIPDLGKMLVADIQVQDVLRVGDVSTGGVHRTYFEKTGGRIGGNAKMMQGPCAGGAVALSEGQGPLVVCEGVETGLSLLSGLLASPATVWAALSTSGMKALALPSAPGDLIVATDSDDAGAGWAAGIALAERAAARGWAVSLWPAPDGQDWNDALREGIAA